ncbi:MAG: type VII toxin-antitoxin system HepT family RNase toxin [Candidatus Rokuibacteriota bacterium]
MVDRDLVLRKLADLDLYLGQVSEYRAIAADEYRRDWKTQRIVERTLQMAIEVCVDVANHVIADQGLRVPATYADAFDVLAEAGLLPGPERDTMVRIVGFRNVVVHEYARVDPEIVVGILREHLDDLARFGATARRWVAAGHQPG